MGDDLNIEVGLTAWTSREGWRAGTLSEQAAWAEAAGFHSLWLPENHFTDNRAVPAPMLLLAAAAAGSERIKLGTTSVLLPIRNPILVAEEVAVLDHLSNGRLIVGLGRGLGEDLFRAFGFPQKEKRQRFRENFYAFLAALCGEPVTSSSVTAESSKHRELVLKPTPLQQPHPPIWLAAFGPLALKQAGTLGLPYLASPLESLTVLTKNYSLHRQAIAEAEKPPVAAVPVMRNVFVADSASLRKVAAEALQASLPPKLGDKSGEVDDWAIVGDRQAVRDRLQQYRDELGLTHLIARGRVPTIEHSEQERSLIDLIDIAAGL